MRNSLELKILEFILYIKLCDYDINNYPFEKALEHYFALKKRRNTKLIKWYANYLFIINLNKVNISILNNIYIYISISSQVDS